MKTNYLKQINKSQECPTRIKGSEGKLVRMLAIDSSEEDAPNYEKKVVLKAPRIGWKLQNTQKLEAMMSKLKKDITVVMNYGENRNEAISEHRIFIRLDLLNTYIEQVIYIKDVIKRGGTIFAESLLSMQKKTNETLNKIREDVFKAYLELETEDKYNIARQGGQMTCIFTLLGIIERELHSTYEKISQAISKRNEHRHKNNKAVAELFTSFRSLPTLKPLKHKSKERLTYTRKCKEKSDVDNPEPGNIPRHEKKADEKILASQNGDKMRHQATSITNHLDSSNTALKDAITSSLHNLEEKLKNVCSTLEKSSDNDTYEECNGPTEIGHLDYKATGFEISISDENIEIKIPTNVIYLVRNSNKSSTKNESEQGEHVVNRVTDRCSINCPPDGSNSSLTDFFTVNTISEESISSFYSDIITDSEIGMELAKCNKIENKSGYNLKKQNKIINYDKCIPFFSENGYCNPVSKENEATKSINSSEIKTDKEEIEKHQEKDAICTLWKENTKLASEYGSKICDLSNPLFGNIIQLVDLIKKIYCVGNSKTAFKHTENLEILANMSETNSLTSTVFQNYNDCPPSISQSSLRCPSIWKESASRLCELCPGCIWVNNQKDDLLSSTSLDLTKRSDWWPAFGRSVAAPVGSVQPNSLVYKPTHDSRALESRLEKILRNAIMKLRPTSRTIWNRYCSSSLKKLLPGLEKAAWSGESNSTSDHIQELQHILASYKMSGFPINMPYNSPSELVDAVKSTGVHMNDAPEIEFSIAVYIHPFPNNVVSVWVYVASLIRRR